MFSNLGKKVYDKNGYYNLGNALRKKYIEYNKSNSVTNKMSDYFSWDEFREIFTTINALWMFSYKNIVFALQNEGLSKYYYWVERNGDVIHPKEFSKQNKDANQLLESITIDNKSLQKIWGDLENH